MFDPDKTSKFEAAIDDIARMVGFGSQRPEQLGDGPDNLWVFHGGAFLVIECKSGATSADGISKHDMGQLGQSMSWFRSKYTDAVPVTPVIIHPHKKLGPGAAIIDDMRVVTKPQLDKLKTALEAFNRSLGDVNIVNDLARIAHLLTTTRVHANDVRVHLYHFRSAVSRNRGEYNTPAAYNNSVLFSCLCIRWPSN